MSLPLRTRVAFHWSSYFSSQATEAIGRTTGFACRDLADYFSLRAATTCAFGQNDLGEKWGGTEVPPELWHHPVLQRMRQLVADVVALRNDSMSLRHEDVTGGHNAIHLIRRSRGCTREEALAEASWRAQEKVDELVEPEERALPRLVRDVGRSQRAALRGYADIIHDWIRGDDEWERITTRHDEYRVMPDWASGLLVSAGS
ncbi:hypothetical protein [Streptomyces sp. NPDC000410]|uniref:terpene synthase family protein n=1 Tax=Streptomyces sp. NPDC000410 TaxID=3154254 RepID=UPI00331FF1F0